MEIIIHRQNYDQLLTLNKIRWKLHVKKNVFQNFIFLTLGIGILLLNGFSLQIEKTDWNFTTSIGLGLIFLATFYFYHIFKAKQQYLSKSKHYIQNFNKQTEGIIIKITDDLITYKDFENYTETKWTAYTHYKIYKDSLLFIAHDVFLSGMNICKDEVSPEQFEELTKFATTRLKPK